MNSLNSSSEEFYKKINSKIFESNGEILKSTKFDKKTLRDENQRTYILTKKSKQPKCCKNIQAGKSYGDGREIKKLTEKTEIKT